MLGGSFVREPAQYTQRRMRRSSPLRARFVLSDAVAIASAPHVPPPRSRGPARTTSSPAVPRPRERAPSPIARTRRAIIFRGPTRSGSHRSASARCAAIRGASTTCSTEARSPTISRPRATSSNTALSDRFQTSERAIGQALRRALARAEGRARRDRRRDERRCTDPRRRTGERPRLRPARPLRELHRHRNPRPRRHPSGPCDDEALPARPDRAQPTQPRPRDARLLPSPGARDPPARARCRWLSRARSARRSRRSSSRYPGAGSAPTGSRPGRDSCCPIPTASHLSIVDLFDIALEVGQADHHLRAIQLPYGLAMGEGAVLASQLGPRRSEPRDPREPPRHRHGRLRERARSTAGRLVGRVPPSSAQAFPEAQSDATAALQFARSTAQVTCAVVGMRDAAHVAENMALARVPRAKPEIPAALFARAARTASTGPNLAQRS